MDLGNLLDGIKNFIWEMNRDEFNKSIKNKTYEFI